MSDPPVQPPVMSSPPGAQIVVDGRTYDYFGGTGYLGLQGHPEVLAAATRAIQTFGMHSATSRTRFSSQPVLNVERMAARFFGTDAAFYFVSGYVGNAVLSQVIAPGVDAVFVDEAAHYCVHEAATLTGRPIHLFASRQPDALRAALSRTLRPGDRPLVMSDGVFASCGSIAPVPAYLDLLSEYPGAALLLDDAHGFGVLGPDGRGTWDHFGLWDTVNRSLVPGEGTRRFVVGTTSKALGGHGGILPGTTELCHAVTSTSHHYDGATAPAAPLAAGTARALQLAVQQPELRDRLRARVRQVRTGLRALGVHTLGASTTSEFPPTPIVGFVHRTAAVMQELHQRLADAGSLVPYASAYSGLGPEGAMRLAVFATHSEDQVDRLLSRLRDALRSS